MPLAHPEQAAIVSSPRIFNDLAAPPRTARRRRTSRPTKQPSTRAGQGRLHRRRSRARSRSCARTTSGTLLDSMVKARGRHRRADRGRQRGAARGAAAHHRRPSADSRPDAAPVRRSATTSPSIRRSAWPAAPAAATACCSTSAIRRNPTRIGAVADSNFSYWHSATFNNDGTKLLFSDEWGGGGAAEVPRHRPEGVGRRRDLHARRPARCSSRATTRCRRRRRRRRTASRTTAR